LKTAAGRKKNQCGGKGIEIFILSLIQQKTPMRILNIPRRRKNLLLPFFLFIIFSKVLTAQTKSEFFVSVDPSNGSFHKIAPIPDIRWIPNGGLTWQYTTFNCKERQYIFKGHDSVYNAYLMTIDATDGSVLHNPAHPNTGDSLDDVFYLQYDTTTNKLYGIYKNAPFFPPFYFVSIDQTTGAINIINTLVGITGFSGGGQYAALDVQNGRYIIKGVNGTTAKLFTIDIHTGNILYSPLSNYFYTDFQFDIVTNKLYGLLLSGTSPNIIHTLVSIDILTGAYTTIATIPGVLDASATGTRYPTFDSNHGRYIFRGGDGAGNWNLYSIDVSNGNVIHSPAYPLPPITPTIDNVIKLQYDNASDTLYALHWGDVETIDLKSSKDESFFSVFPNPSNGQLNISSSSVITHIEVTNQSGQSVYSSASTKKDHLLHIEKNGVYYLTVSTKDQKATRKIVVMR
jgi:transcription antitermination factor NusG